MANNNPATIVFTIGHSTRALDDFIALLREAGVEHLIDVRRFPHSRRQPQFNIETLSAALGKTGIGYTHMEALGGRRKARADGKPSQNTLWREEGFRNYADYAETEDFHAAFDELLKLAGKQHVAIMCAEALWWQCHRRIITDYLLAAKCDVRHILTDKIEAAKLTDGAIVRADQTVLYSATPLLA